ncbi:MAG TPA: hypothetical protein VH254_07405 [Candidatus Udaeobacter sp.]|nr:hypothetical protein [Candidatus Udaeobacter sp.]
MKTGLVSDERNGNQSKDYNEDDALFVFRELENAEQALHLVV